MAVRQDDKRAIINKILPKKIDYEVTNSGIQILCDRITTPRILKFDSPGHCKSCMEVGFCVEKRGVWVDCSRIKGLPFVPFDVVYDFPNHTVFRVKCKGRIFPIPHDSVDDDDDDGESPPIFISKSAKNFNKSANKGGGSISSSGKENDDANVDDEDEIMFLGERKGATNKPFRNFVKQEIELVNGSELGNESGRKNGEEVQIGENPTSNPIANDTDANESNDNDNSIGKFSGTHKRRLSVDSDDEDDDENGNEESGEKKSKNLYDEIAPIFFGN